MKTHKIIRKIDNISNDSLKSLLFFDTIHHFYNRFEKMSYICALKKNNDMTIIDIDEDIILVKKLIELL